MLEKPTSHKSLYKGYFLEFVEDEVIIDTVPPIEARRQYFVHPGGVCIVPVLANGNVVMVKQYRTPVAQVLYEFPAGKIDKNEDPFDTAKRELAEETGYRSENWTELGGLLPCPGYCTEVLHMYIARDLVAGVQNLDHGEIVELVEISVAEATRMVMTGEIRDAKTVAGLFMLRSN